MTISVRGPDGSNFTFPDGTDSAVISDAMSKHYGGGAPEADPVTANKVVRAAATGVPVVGGVLNKMDAATNATLAPIVEPLLAPSASDISRPGPSTEKIGDVPVPARAPGWAERYRRSLEMQNKGDEQFAAAHPYIDTAAKVAGGVGGSIPAMMAAPAAFGLTGPLPQMVMRGAASNAALAAADAAVRGENIVAPAAIAGAAGAAAPLVARAVGKGVQAVRDYRNPAPVVPQNVERAGGVDIPLTTGQATADPAVQAEEEIMRRGARGSSAEAIARQADEEAKKALEEATSGIAASLDPRAVNPDVAVQALASPRTAPQAAGQLVQSELAAQAAAQDAARAAQVSRVGAEGETLARGLGGGAAPVSPFDAAEKTGAAVAARRAASVERTKQAYKARDEVAGEFDPSVPQGLAEDIRARLQTGPASERIHVDPVNESVANKALKIIDQTVGRDSGLFADAAVAKLEPAPARAAVGLPAKATEDETVAALRAKFGDSVADAYAKQNAPQPLSLLEFIASKGGLKPDAELDAIGLNHGHRSQIPGQKGFFGTVRQNGSSVDRMREAAQEAGYFRDSHGGTSTPTEFLDAIDAELRGQKKYPAGHEGFKSKRDTAKTETRESAQSDRINQGFADDLAAAGHGGLNPELKQRAVGLMREEGMSADDAVETAFRHAEQEDAAGAARAASDFPGDRQAGTAAAVEAKPVDLRTMDDARKQLVTLYKDAKRKAVMQGDSSDLRAMGRILHEFDNSISDAMAAGKFSGDAKLAKELQEAARKSHAEYKETYSAKPGDEIGRAVEKILGRYSDTAATPEQIQALSYGPKGHPGTGNSVKVALRLKKILSPEEFAQWKSGLFKYVDDSELSMAKRAGRIDNFLQTSLAKGAMTADERASMSAYSRNLRAAEPSGRPSNDLEKAVARIAGTDGHLPASPIEVADMLYSRTGKGDKGVSQRLAAHLKQNLTPESWTAVRQGMWEKLTNAGEGKIPFEAQALSQRLHEFLNESGKGLSTILFTAPERAEIAKLAGVYKRMIPAKGTTNPSGSATIGARIARKSLDHLGAMLGYGAHGLPGAIVGHMVQKGAGALKDARAAKEATRLFFGVQSKRAVQSSRLPVLLAPAVPASQR
jgi:hypothetical protein